MFLELVRKPVRFRMGLLSASTWSYIHWSVRTRYEFDCCINCCTLGSFHELAVHGCSNKNLPPNLCCCSHISIPKFSKSLACLIRVWNRASCSNDSLLRPTPRNCNMENSSQGGDTSSNPYLFLRKCSLHASRCFLSSRLSPNLRSKALPGCNPCFSECSEKWGVLKTSPTIFLEDNLWPPSQLCHGSPLHVVQTPLVLTSKWFSLAHLRLSYEHHWE